LFEHVILSNLLVNEGYTRAVLPFLKEDYFSGSEKVLFNIAKKFIVQYNSLPSKEVMNIELTKETLNEKEFKEAAQTLTEIEHDSTTDQKYLIDETEKFCQDKAIQNALRKSISIMDDQAKKNAIPKLLQDALAVSFDSSVGHDFFEDADKRFAEYHTEKNRLRFDIDLMNVILKGGMLPATMMILMAGTGVGKSLTMCSFAASFLAQGKNVLYITMEMGEIAISQRIDHNLLDVDEDALMAMPKDMYNRRLAKIREKTKGKLIVKGFPSGAAHAGHFRHLIDELKLKKNIVPDVVFIDYLNICASSRMKMGGSVNTYVLVKSVAEEIRGLGQEYGFPIITATQTNRDGINSSDIDMTNISESMGMAHTADYMLALISSEELVDLDQIIIKQIKNRYGDPNKFRKFIVGFDRARMKVYNVENATEEESNNTDDSVMDKTNFGKADRERKDSGKRRRFAGFY